LRSIGIGSIKQEWLLNAVSSRDGFGQYVIHFTTASAQNPPLQIATAIATYFGISFLPLYDLNHLC
jgi:hypothetical protein